MSTSEALDQLRSRILSGYPLLFLKTWEEDRWEEALSNLALEIERGLVLWSLTTGPQPQIGSEELPDPDRGANPRKFLRQIADYPPDHLFLIKDFHPFLSDPQTIRLLRDLAISLEGTGKTLLLMGPTIEIPLELQKEAVSIDLPLPELEELREVWGEVLSHREAMGDPLEVDATTEEKMLKAVLGLSQREARKALARSIQGRDHVDDEVFAALVSEKKHLIQGSDLLEFYELQEGVDDVGGLDSLKDWLRQRAQGFTVEAQEQGIPAPKGVLLLGVQGCRKSLTSRAAARLLSFPLVRLDASNLLTSNRGGSENNMRDVLRLMEIIAPAVLWLDEIEKGFAGLDEDAGSTDATIARIFGKFLTWMEERRAPVFVVATANSVEHLPPEMLRRGRFDELFFIDLPNYEERKTIFRIHLAKRGWNPEKYDLAELALGAEGYSGAEIEQIVISAMLEAYSQGRVLTEEDLNHAREMSVPLSKTMEEKIFQLREWARGRCRPATPDSRVVQMLEEEERSGGFDESLVSPEASREWVNLAEYGQIKAAIVAFINSRDRVTFPRLQEAFAPHLKTAGDQGVGLKSDPNVVLWVGMSQELASVLVKLIAEKRLYIHRAGMDLYEGHELELPRLQEVSEDRLTRPMWFPCYLAAFPPETANPRLARVARMKLK